MRENRDLEKLRIRKFFFALFSNVIGWANWEFIVFLFLRILVSIFDFENALLKTYHYLKIQWPWEYLGQGIQE